MKDVQYDGEDFDDNFDALKRHMQQLSEDYARVVEEPRCIEMQLSAAILCISTVKGSINIHKRLQLEACADFYSGQFHHFESFGFLESSMNSSDSLVSLC